MIRTASFSALGTTAVVATTDPLALPRARAMLGRRLEALDRACSRFRDDSELMRANRRAGSTVAVGPLLAESVGVALAAAHSTGGLVDPTLGADLCRAGYDRTFALVRARDGWTVRAAAPRVAGWHEVEVDARAGTLRVPRGVELDLGATAKAWAADRAADAIAAATGAGVLVSLGGDVATAGVAPPGGWSIRIADDHSAPLDAPGPLVAIAGGGLATSGTAARRWRTDRGEAHHVIDPRTGLPAVTPWRTVSVAAASCLDANIAATAAVVVGCTAAEWLDLRRVPGRLVRADGAVVHVGGWPPAAEEADAA